MATKRFQTSLVVPVVTAGIYSAQDVVGGLLTFTFKAPVASGGGLVRGVQIYDNAKVNADLDLYLFQDLPATIANNAAWALANADLRKLIAGPLNTPAYVDYVTGSSAIFAASNFPIQFSGNKLYGYLVCVATPTYIAVTDLAIRLDVEV